MNKEPVNHTPESMIEATPKTDAECDAADNDHVHGDFARQLERALIESERKLRRSEAEAITNDAKYRGAIAACATFVKQRDEAERKLEQARQALEQIAGRIESAHKMREIALFTVAALASTKGA